MREATAFLWKESDEHIGRVRRQKSGRFVSFGGATCVQMTGEYRSHESQQLTPAFRHNLGQGFVDDAGNVLSQATLLASSRSW